MSPDIVNNRLIFLIFSTPLRFSQNLGRAGNVSCPDSSFELSLLCFTVTFLPGRGPAMPPKATSPPAVPPPDGGWGWAVVFGAFISIGFSYAFPKAITVFFKDIQIIFNASYSEIAWISSIMLAVMYAAGETPLEYLRFVSPHIGFLCFMDGSEPKFC